VYYNPVDPADCALDVTTRKNSIVRVISSVAVGLVVGLIGIAIVLVAAYYILGGLIDFLKATK